MRKIAATGGALGSLLAGAVIWFVLYVIIGVTLWVSFVAGGGVALAGLLLATPLIGGRKSHGSEPTGPGGPHTPIGAR